MSHFPVHDQISAYVDDRLSPSERAQVEALLESSEEARAELDSYHQLRATLKALPVEPAPTDLVQRVIGQAEQESLHGKPAAAKSTTQKAETLSRWTIPAVSIAASVALTVFVMLQLQSIQSPVIHTASEELVSMKSRELSDDSVVAFEVEGATLADRDAAGLGRELVLEERQLDLSDSMEFTHNVDENGTMNMISAFDISHAQVGDVVDSWQLRDNEIVVVQVMVIDRQQVLDSVQVLLSDMNIPREAPESNSYGERRNDVFAVYVEAEKGQLQTVLQNLQKNMDVEQMLVSTSIPSEDLNPYVVEQGYATLDSFQFEDAQTSSSRMSIPAESPVEESLGLTKSGERGSNRPAAAPLVADRANESEALLEKKSETLKRSLEESESTLPPPPPLPHPVELAAPKSVVAEAAPAETPAPLDAAKPEQLNFYRYQPRLIELRLPESVGRQLVIREKPLSQLSVLNRDATNRSFLPNDTARMRRQIQLDELSEPALLPSTTPRPEPAPQPSAAPAPKVTAPDAGNSLADLTQESEAKEAAARPMQILFLLTDEPAPATKAAPADAPEAASKPER